MDQIFNLIIENGQLIITTLIAGVIRHYERKRLVKKFKLIIEDLNSQINDDTQK